MPPSYAPRRIFLVDTSRKDIEAFIYVVKRRKLLFTVQRSLLTALLVKGDDMDNGLRKRTNALPVV